MLEKYMYSAKCFVPPCDFDLVNCVTCKTTSIPTTCVNCFHWNVCTLGFCLCAMVMFTFRKFSSTFISQRWCFFLYFSPWRYRGQGFLLSKVFFALNFLEGVSLEMVGLYDWLKSACFDVKRIWGKKKEGTALLR